MIFTILIVLIAIVTVIGVRNENRCPKCGGKLINDMYDPIEHHSIYTCEDCHEEWIVL